MHTYFKSIKHYTLKSLIISFSSFYFLVGCGGTPRADSGSADGVDRTAPKISLIGSKHIIIHKNESFQDPGATALDNVDGDVSSAIRFTHNININAPGDYEIHYSVKDSAGNTGTKKRTVSVIDVITPTPREGLTINEVLVANTHTLLDPSTKQYSGWIELYNNSNRAINLRGYSLSDGTTRWNFPTRTLNAYSYLLVWADGSNNNTHTNFHLNQDGESIILMDNNGDMTDSITFGKQKSDISFTKQNGMLYYMTPTPNRANTKASTLLTRTKKPDFSLQNSFYNSNQSLTLSHENGATIYYTTDGSIPTKSSKIYENPISISHNTVVRARALESDKFMSSVKNRSYFINEDVSIPVMSLALDEKYFSGSAEGIYANPNYKQDWVRAGSLEYIKDGKSQFSENIGVRIHGQSSRENPKKSFNIYAKDKFGPKSIKYPLFADKPIKKFKSLVLKNGGDDGKHRSSMIQNALIHYIVKDNMDIDYVSYQPCVLFINGRYWGVYNIREKDNEDYIQANHGIDDKNVEYVRVNDHTSGHYTNPRSDAYDALITHLNDYTYLESHMDINEYMNYIIAELYDANTDWPSTNTTAWRELSATGKWRWTLNDTDNGFSRVNYDGLAVLRSPTLTTSYQNPAWATQLFRALLSNDTFKTKFASKFMTHINSTFKTQRVNDIVAQMTSVVSSEMPRDFNRWRIANAPGWSTLQDSLFTFANTRTDTMRTFLRNNLNLSGTPTISVTTANNGNVLLDEVPLTESFRGDYFNNAQISLKAVPKEGYTFDYWQVNTDTYTEQSIDLQFSTDTTVQAHFKRFQSPKVVINEINFKSEKSFDTKDWIELYNGENHSINLSGWKIQDALDSSAFILPEGIRIHAGAYLVLTKDKTKFQVLHTNVSQLVGDFGFGVSSSGDTLKLYDNTGSLVDSVIYDKSWLDNISKGYTLALDNPDYDNTQKANWHAGHLHGTPGSAN